MKKLFFITLLISSAHFAYCMKVTNDECKGLFEAYSLLAQDKPENVILKCVRLQSNAGTRFFCLGSEFGDISEQDSRKLIDYLEQIYSQQ